VLLTGRSHIRNELRTEPPGGVEWSENDHLRRGVAPDSYSAAERIIDGWDAPPCRREPISAAKGAAKAARRHGYESAAKAGSFYVRDVDGPLLEGEIGRARAWGRQLAASITQAAT
jgi:hypothetical protein